MTRVEHLAEMTLIDENTQSLLPDDPNIARGTTDPWVETIRTLLSSGLLTLWWSNEHPAGKGFGQPKKRQNQY